MPNKAHTVQFPRSRLTSSDPECATDEVYAKDGPNALTKSDSLPIAAGKRSPHAANPSRKCAGISKQLPGASNTPLVAALSQKLRASTPDLSHGKTVIPPCGRTQSSVFRCSAKNCSRCTRFLLIASRAFEKIISLSRVAWVARVSLITEFEAVK